MKFSTHISSILSVAILALALQNCAVDPLDTTDSPNTNGSTGYTLCSDTSLKDSDGDGVNDDCEKMLGTDPNTKDSDGDGIPDSSDMPTNPQSPVCPPTTQDQSLIDWCGGVSALQNQLLNDTVNSSVLASSGLNQQAPLGTKVEVSSQTIRIVHNKMGLQEDQAAYDFCKREKAQLETFLYYEISGDVMYCQGSLTDCQVKGPTTKALMKLCGPLTESVAWNQTTTTSVDIAKFVWTAGYASNYNLLNKKVEVEFNPVLLQGNSQIDSTALTIKSSGSSNNGVYEKMSVKFKSTFKIAGTIQDGEHEGEVIKTAENIEVLRNFIRPVVAGKPYNSETTPGLTGLWAAGL